MPDKQKLKKKDLLKRIELLEDIADLLKVENKRLEDDMRRAEAVLLAIDETACNANALYEPIPF